MTGVVRLRPLADRGSRDAQHAVQKTIPELSAGIVGLRQRPEVFELRVQRGEVVKSRSEKFAPVRPGTKLRKRGLKFGQHSFHIRLQRLPREVQCDALL